MTDLRVFERHAPVGGLFVAAIACAVTACASIMGVDDPILATDGDGGVADGATSTIDPTLGGEDAAPPADGCHADDGCTDPRYPKCAAGKCVACTPEADVCPAGRLCNASNECVPGCRSDADCKQISPSAPYCNMARHQCVSCRSNDECQGGRICSPAGVCTEACTIDGGTCAGGKTCCAGLCVDTKSDSFNCNTCGNACGGAGAQCCGGACVDLLADSTHCGSCETQCSTTHGTPSCSNGACEWACEDGYAHCSAGNSGCETQTSDDPAHCGKCTTSCDVSVKNATGKTCSGGRCTYATCEPGFGDCDGRRANGCDCECGQSGQDCCPGDQCLSGKCLPTGKCK